MSGTIINFRFRIEPFITRANRLARELTDEERALRRQFLKDQQLHPSDGKYIQELEPRNFFRRTLSAPWDAISKPLRRKFVRLHFLTIIRTIQ